MLQISQARQPADWLQIGCMARPSERRRIELLEFARRLTISIAALGYTKASFARTISVDRGRLHHWAAGLNYPDPEKLLEMDRVHGLDPNWLLKGRTSGLSQELARKIQSTIDSKGISSGLIDED